MPLLRLFLSSTLCLLLLAACERPFVATVPPAIRPADADAFETVQHDDTLLLRLDVTSFRAIDHVTVDGAPLAREASSHLWSRRVPLDYGVNAFVVEATDVGNVTATDTLYVLRMGVAPLSVAGLPEARGAHTLTPLLDGRLLLAGGTSQAGGDASDAAFVLDPARQTWSRLTASMQRARAEHTATLLPDGRVLLVGGRTRERSRALADFVPDAEVFDPSTNAFTLLPLDGAPVTRAQHTALLRRVGDLLVLELLGGEGTIGFLSSPRFGVRDDLRPFAIRNDRLEALAPGRSTGQGSPVEPLAGHLTVRLTGIPPEGDGDYLIAGATFSSAGAASRAFRLRVREQGLRLLAAAAPHTPRTRATAVALDGTGVLAMGGQTEAALAPLATADVYLTVADRWLRLPNVSLNLPVYATSLAWARDIGCLAGGFDAAGRGTDAVNCWHLRLR